MKSTYTTKSAAQTRKLGARFAKKLARKEYGTRALVIGLQGELGSGKTNFLQGFAKGLGIKEKVLSPTFVLMKKFKIPSKRFFHMFYHIDCYRLYGQEDLLQMGLKEIITDPHNLVVIEWADRVKNILPKERVSATFASVDENTRNVVLQW